MPTSFAFAQGSFYYTQILDSTYSYRIAVGSNHLDHLDMNGASILDTANPYPYPAGPFPTGANLGPNAGKLFDHPAFREPDINNYSARYYEAEDQFSTFLMFTAASPGSISVPLKKETWGWRGKFYTDVNASYGWAIDTTFSTQWRSDMGNTLDLPEWNSVKPSDPQWLP